LEYFYDVNKSMLQHEGIVSDARMFLDGLLASRNGAPGVGVPQETAIVPGRDSY
jgi:hypothetical protein